MQNEQLESLIENQNGEKVYLPHPYLNAFVFSLGFAIKLAEKSLLGEHSESLSKQLVDIKKRLLVAADEMHETHHFITKDLQLIKLAALLSEAHEVGTGQNVPENGQLALAKSVLKDLDHTDSTVSNLVVPIRVLPKGATDPKAGSHSVQ